jgi:hypothetical protein
VPGAGLSVVRCQGPPSVRGHLVSCLLHCGATSRASTIFLSFVCLAFFDATYLSRCTYRRLFFPPQFIPITQGWTKYDPKRIPSAAHYQCLLSCTLCRNPIKKNKVSGSTVYIFYILLFNVPQIQYVGMEWDPFHLRFRLCREYTNQKLRYFVTIINNVICIPLSIATLFSQREKLYLYNTSIIENFLRDIDIKSLTIRINLCLS